MLINLRRTSHSLSDVSQAAELHPLAATLRLIGYLSIALRCVRNKVEIRLNVNIIAH